MPNLQITGCYLYSSSKADTVLSILVNLHSFHKKVKAGNKKYKMDLPVFKAF